MRPADRSRAHHRLGIVLANALGSACFAEPGDAQTETETSTLGSSSASGEASSSQGPADGGPGSESGPPADGTGTGTGTTSADATGRVDSSEGDSVGTTGEPAVCGNGIVDQPTEMCDGSLGCLEDCTFVSYACNPLNNAGCGPGLRCGLDDFNLESFACMTPGPSALGEMCSGVPFNDSDCGDGLTCLWNINTAKCDEGDCCVQYCDLQDPTSGCSVGAVCNAFFPRPMFQGLEHLGFCGEPF
jgi:hypothetical protein